MKKEYDKIEMRVLNNINYNTSIIKIDFITNA